MKLEFVINEAARFEKPMLVWHGTSLKNIRSILKHGLLADKKDVSPWKQGEDRVPGTPFHSDSGGESYKGVYVAEKVAGAVDAAEDYPEIALVAIQMQRSGLAIDEDNVYSLIEGILKRIFRETREQEFLGLTNRPATTQEEIHKLFMIEFNNKFIITSDRNKQRDVVWKELQSYEPFLKELIDISYQRASNWEHFTDTQKREAQSRIRKVYDKITLKLGRLKDADINIMKTHRHAGNVGFSGSSKIIAVFSYNKQTNDPYTIFETDFGQQAERDLLAFSKMRKEAVLKRGY